MTDIRQTIGEYPPDCTDSERHFLQGAWLFHHRHRGPRVALVFALGLSLIGGSTGGVTTAAASSRGSRYGNLPTVSAPYLAQSERVLRNVDGHLNRLLRRGGPERTRPFCSFREELGKYVEAREALRRRIEIERKGGAGTPDVRREVATLLGDLQGAYGDVLSCYR